MTSERGLKRDTITGMSQFGGGMDGGGGKSRMSILRDGEMEIGRRNEVDVTIITPS